ncbi:MAG: DUF3108 domain-containing protein [Planctomycetia bacterium]|nr:DUF3108 domain-containing protein [Planctomycetia bacterium]
MRNIAVSLLLVVASFVVHTSFAADQDKQPDYYPLAAGTKWTFHGEAGGQKIEVTNQVAKIETIDNQPLVRVETLVGGKIVANEHLKGTDAGVFRHRFNGGEMVPPVCVIKYPVVEGDSWKSNVKIGPESVDMTSRVEKEEEIEVPAGKYKAVKVRVDANTKGQKITNTYWFAPGVGIVKQEAAVNGGTIVMNLAKFEPGK